MNQHHSLRVARLLVALALGLSPAMAAKKQPVPPPAPLGEAGRKLEAEYAATLKALQEDIARALPKIDGPQEAALLKAYQDEAAATMAERKTMQGQAKSKDKEAAAKAHAAAKEALALATTNAQAPAKAVLADLDKFLTSDQLDAKLVKCVVLSQATPRGLAEFAQQGKEQQSLVDKLLADDDLMKQMLVADGAAGGRYGQAMKIYTDIQQASPPAKDGILQRLALGTSLEHAVPVGQRNAVAQTDAPTTVDAVQRYLHYQQAFLAGELDPGFKELSVWDCRFVGNGDEPDEVLAWGREMLRNYNPAQIATSDTRWRYVEAVKTDVKYGSQDQKNDLPTLGFYQNIINTGGVCGRRAFFGRFILRSFGMPTLARPQPGHATLVHWTPAGWVINLGASWGWGSVDGNFDTDFLAMTQARMVAAAYPEVLRAQWVGTVLGEKMAPGFGAAATGFWNGVALYRQRAIIEKAKAVTLAAVGTDIGEANESKEKEVVKAVTVIEADRKIVVGQDGVITIPAVACSKPTNSTGKIRFMKSYLGGMQLHYSRLGNAEGFEYAFDAPAAGKYALSARVVTVSPDQHLLVAANDAKEPVDIAAPYTIGKWEQTQAVEVSLVKGRNVLRFSRGGENIKGMTIKDFTLKPVK
ncbi:MAG: hypothetical protein K9M97_01105 [Akkermansiaceae bacterium]|nr:hypothetical protein [Akkermansiaceae bacterium]